MMSPAPAPIERIRQHSLWWVITTFLALVGFASAIVTLKTEVASDTSGARTAHSSSTGVSAGAGDLASILLPHANPPSPKPASRPPVKGKERTKRASSRPAALPGTSIRPSVPTYVAQMPATATSTVTRQARQTAQRAKAPQPAAQQTATVVDV